MADVAAPVTASQMPELAVPTPCRHFSVRLRGSKSVGGA